VVAVIKRHRLGLLLATTALALVVAGVVFLLRTSDAGSQQATPTLQGMQITPVTTTGNAWRPALSPDGKYVVYISPANTGGSLWVRQLSTQSSVEIVPAQPGLRIRAATVTPDGSFVDFVRGQTFTSLALWRVPFLGGSPRLLVDSVSSPIGWSPDRRQFAFVRASFDGWSHLIVADADGTRERRIAERSLPSQLMSIGSGATPSGGAHIQPAWSPDGKTIALIGFDAIAGNTIVQAVFVDAVSGSERSIALPDSGLADGIEWLDRDQVVVSLRGDADSSSQLWLLSYSDGKWSRLTNDLSNYASLSISSARDSIATARWEERLTISVQDGDRVFDVVPSTTSDGGRLAWSGDRLLFALTNPGDGRTSIWRTRPGESSPPEELIANAEAPATTKDGQSIAFVRVEQGRASIWRADGNGRRAVEVISQAGLPVWLPDGKRIAFANFRSGYQTPWVVSVEGGEPFPLVKRLATNPTFSPDGNAVAFFAYDEKVRPITLTCDSLECRSTREIPIPRNAAALQWTPDGMGLSYALRSNVWIHPLNSRAPYQVTRFVEDDHTIVDFDWSGNGKRLAVSRTTKTWDIVLFRGIKP
jgi:TolB protein